ncbi:MAG: helix-turn-helix domain-containing protein [Oscillospiraceae bacterium]
MSLSEKIIDLRKRSGWSQEELGDRLGISRQSVSKWESGASVPDIDKILKLSQLFGVSTDYLLKDEPEKAPVPVSEQAVWETGDAPIGRSVSMAEAGVFLDAVGRTAGKFALGVSLCILSPVCLLLLCGLSQEPWGGMSENLAVGAGVAILLVLVAAAVALFITNGMLMSRFEYLEKESFRLESGVESLVSARMEEFEPRYRRAITLGVVLCIVGVIPLMLCLAAESQLACVFSVCLILVFCAVGVNLLARAGSIHGGYQKLLQVGDYTPEKKEVDKTLGTLSGVYWCIVTALYLGISFYFDNWDRSWIVWPVAGVLFAAVYGIAFAVVQKKKRP